MVTVNQSLRSFEISFDDKVENGDSMARSAEVLVSQAMSSLETMGVPKALQDSIDRHQRHLLSLAASLLACGKEEATVEQLVDAAFSSYKQELVNTIMALRENSSD